MVWTYLHVSVAYAAARVADGAESQTALALFALQIALNALWTPSVFEAQRPGFGMVVIAALWLSVAAMGWQCLRLDILAGLLVLPYLVWLGLAAALNWRLWRDNPGAGKQGAAGIRRSDHGLPPHRLPPEPDIE